MNFFGLFGQLAEGCSKTSANFLFYSYCTYINLVILMVVILI